MTKDILVSILKFLLAIVGVLIVFVGAFLFVGWPSVTKNATYGMTFSRPYAEELGLNPDHVLATALDDVGITHFRIPAYWSLLEPTQGTWDFSLLDKDLAAIAQRNGKVVLAVGQKLPRWPECWGPDWWKKMSSETDKRNLTLKYIETVVTRYRNDPTIEAWQVENEPHFAYGDCPAPDMAFTKQEIEFVRGLDPTRPIYTTDSGELSTWTSFDGSIDKLGVSVYRVVRNPIFGDMNLRYWFVPPYLYARKAMLASLFGVKAIYVSEFQMEPWSNKPLTETDIASQLGSMDVKQMTSNFAFAERMDISRVDFWGIEWWVWMKEKQNHPEFLEAAKEFWGKHANQPSKH